ncbi:hypothetical protein M9Q43_00790 [Flavobacterium sp. HXWNR29]|uniref:hypothetical protein n=1 Tax=Flavobacterium odoriferum TaxID=2946604 RepID=UPI0021CAF907|nr:hypothetical protein [Flavobacterium sp. HXWNR29]MCU4187697.1 hypothetical protein [Flavobacterium sp. HXWNR29]
MKSTLLFFLTILLFSCKQSENHKGNLYFKLINLTSPSGLTDKQAINTEKIINSMVSDEKNKEFVDYYKNVIKHDLLKNPYLQLETEDGIKKVYLNFKEYDKIKHFKLSELQEKSKKVTIELNAKELEKDLFYSEEIILIQEVDGKTPWQK